MAHTVSKLLNIARNEIGYHEKNNTRDLDSKTSSTDGSGNFTKYARDLANAKYYQASKQGYEWCDMFVDWCFYQLCDKDKVAAEKMISQTGPYGAGCSCSANYFRTAGRWFTSPKPGDQIFFGKYKSEEHTGIVEAVNGNTVTTIEGNSHNKVERCTYSLTNSWISGYGRPFFDPEDGSDPEPEPIPEPEPKEYDKEEFIRQVQKAIGAKVDGIAGPETLSKTITISQRINRKHSLVLVIQKYLNAIGYTQVGTIDGIAGPKFDAAVRAYQKDHGCYVDGEITARNKTWKKLLGLA